MSEPSATGARVHIDRTRCGRSGLCWSTAPGLFGVDRDGIAVSTVDKLTDPETIDLAQDIADCCPTEAITIE